MAADAGVKGESVTSRWERAVGAIRRAVPPQDFDAAFSGVELVSCEGGRLVLSAPDERSRAALEGRFAALVAMACCGDATGEIAVEVSLRPRAPRPDAPEAPASFPAELPTLRGSSPRAELNPKYTFAEFVIGPSNRLAHAAALAVSDSPGTAYNPLFIHAGVGLGKTHLLQAICHKLLERPAPPVLVYTSCDDFQSRLFSAVQDGRLDEFRAWIRRADVLVVDDIHFLAQRERTQEEFFHVFNSLYNAHRQIILSCDSPPGDIPAVEERLVSRFRWGLVAEIEPPSYETRLEIVRRKARLRGEELPDSVAEAIARSTASNVREIEGAVIRILGYAALMGSEIDEDLAAEVLDPARRRSGEAGRVSIDEVLRAVAEFFDVPVPALQSKSRERSVVSARHVAMYLVRQLCGASLKACGGHFGGRDHSTVKYACDKVADELARGGRAADAVAELKAAITRRRSRRPLPPSGDADRGAGC